MATRIRTIDFLPEIFQTNTNDQFLSATLDQLVQPPDFRKVQGYIGSKFGYGVKTTDQYVTEPTLDKTNYQLEPTVVFTDPVTGNVTDAITYPGLIDAIRLESGLQPNHNSLFKNEFYSWDSFVDLDKLINFGQYYWIPEGPESVDITTETVLENATIKVISNVNSYQFEVNGSLLPTENPTLTLVRGGKYTFEVDETSKFYIQSLPGMEGVDPNKTNFSTREISGIEFNGISSGMFTYNVPNVDAQDSYIFSGLIPVDLVTTLPFDQVNGAPLNIIKNIDGVTDIEGKTLIFYGADPNDRIPLGDFFDSVGFDTDNTLTPGFDGFENEPVTGTVFKITLVGDPGSAVIKLVPNSIIEDDTNIVINSGVQYIGRTFVKNSYGVTSLIPPITATLSTLYYQDEANSLKFGKIKIIDKPTESVIDVLDIIGQKTYTSPNGIKFSNGLRVKFIGSIFPTKYLNDSYYVEGVGTSIQLIPSSELIVPELYSQSFSAPFDDPASGFDQTGFSDIINLPYTPDYITISRSSLDRNGWTRGNRWFHVDVLKTIAENNLLSPIVNKALTTGTNRASRPIIEFYPNLKLLYHGNFGKAPVDYIDTVTTDALTTTTGSNPDNYLPDGENSNLFDGCRIIFANDNNVEVRNKIFVATIASVNNSKVITLTKASDGDIVMDDQIVIVNGTTNKGYNYYYNGIDWINSQTKTTVNQAPLFDIFDSNNISFSDNEYYPGTDFRGCTLFQYSIGSGVKDTVLGIPIQYSGVGNLNDINFESTLNSATFNYVINNQSINEAVNYGYVYQYTDKTNYVRKLGWETAVDTSFQYQVFNFTYEFNNTNKSFTLDIPLKDSTTTAWPTSVLYVNNSRIDSYNVTVTTTETVVIITSDLTPGDTITVMAYSDSISNIGYYQVPSNLQQNPFNYQITTINAGDIRGHYKSICNNIPGLTGQSFGANNYRDLGNPVPYGTRIIQNSAAAVTPAAFIRKQETNFFNGVNYNATEYVKFKALLMNTVNSQDYTPYDSASDMLDDVLDIISSAKTQSSPFFWSDMLPSKTPSVVNTYTFAVGISNTVYPLAKVYSFNIANYESVLVYVGKMVNGIMQYTQLLKDVDYFVNASQPYVLVSATLEDSDVVTVKEYTQTYGNYIPNTPTKVGLYPKFIPEIILDETYLNPTYFIKGHDGSLTKLYDTFDNYGNLIDFRDKVLFEFECRIYNNIKVDAKIPLMYADIFPGQFRTTDYTYDQVMQLYTTSFLNWIGLNRIDIASQYYDATDEYTWNYNQAKNKIDNTAFKQGNWRGIYMWFYDTATPHATPWEMLGLPVKPIWWDERYGLPPYTSDNTLLWTDLSNGYVYNNGNPIIDDRYTRPNLLSILPVNSNGELLSPFESLVRNYSKMSFNSNWAIGDMGPAEYSYRKSSTWPFDLMRIFALAKPAQFFTLGLDLDVYKYNDEFKQYLVYDRLRTTGRQQLNLYGHDSNSAAHSYMNWIIDYLNQYGLPGTTIIENLLTYVDVRLSYRVSGYTDKNKVNFYIEKGSPNSTNSSLIIPDDSYTIIQYQNEPGDTIVYSSVIIQKTENGYKVYGNSQTQTYFLSSVSITKAKQKLLTVLDLQVYIDTDFSNQLQYTTYGNEFRTITELANFLAGYGHFLTLQGMVFDDVENNTPLTWEQMIAEMLYWVQTGWEVGSVINLNPCSSNFHVEKSVGIIQPFTQYQNNFVLNQNLVPVNLNDLAIYRKDTTFKMKILTNGDTISYVRADVSISEHIVIFDNQTVFNDILYNLITGLRQQRLYVKGSKTNQWDGTLYAPGFIQNQNNVVDWKENTKYTKGTIVFYKRKYWMANKTVIVPSPTFNYNDWILTSYDKIDTGILANPSTRASESEYYYDTHRSNIQNDGDLLAFSLIGYRPRSYLADADLDDISQVNIYQNMIAEKGTLDIANSFQGATIQKNDLAYTINENWAIKTSEYGGVLNHNFVEFTLDENLLTGNPAIISLINGNNVDIAQQQVPLYKITNYGRSVTNTNILPTITDSSITKLPSAGYANLDDITLYSYTVQRISNTVVKLVYKNDYIWIADKQSDWGVYTPYPLNYLITTLVNNLNDTCTLNFTDPHGLVQYDVIAVVNNDPTNSLIINGFYTVQQILNNKSISINLSLQSNITTITFSQPVLLYKFQSLRISSPTEINTLPLLNFEYDNVKVWIDKNASNDWAVYQKTNNYNDINFEIFDINNGALGSAVAYVPPLGYYVSDPSKGNVYKYIRSGRGDIKTATMTHGTGYGTAIARNSEFMIISEPSDTISKLYIYRIVALPEVEALVEEQVLTVSGTYVGTSMAFSGDSNYLFVGAPKINSVFYFQRQVDYTLLPVLGSKKNTPLICQLITETNPLDRFFVVDGNAVSAIPAGKRITFTQYKQYNTSTLLAFGYEPKVNTSQGIAAAASTTINVSAGVFGTADRKYYFVLSGQYDSDTHVAFDPTVDNTDYIVKSSNSVYDTNTNSTKLYANDFANSTSFDQFFKYLNGSNTSYSGINIPVWTFTNVLPTYLTVLTGEYVDTVVDKFKSDGSTTTYNLSSTSVTGVVRNKITTPLPNSNYGNPAQNFSNVSVTLSVTVPVYVTHNSTIVTMNSSILVTTAMKTRSITIFNTTTRESNTFTISDIDIGVITTTITLSANYTGPSSDPYNPKPIDAVIKWSTFDYQLTQDTITLNTAADANVDITVTTTIDRTVIHTVERIGYSISVNQLVGTIQDVGHGTSYLQEMALTGTPGSPSIASTNTFIATVNNQFNFIGFFDMLSYDAFYLGKNPGDLSDPTNPTSNSVLYQTTDNFGATIAVNHDASKIFIGSPTYHVRLSPDQNVPPVPDVGVVWEFNRLIETFQVLFTPQQFVDYVVILPWQFAPTTIVSLNGVNLSKKQYAIVGGFAIQFIVKVKAGDIITVSSPNLVLTQALTNYETIDGVIPSQRFGTSIACNSTGSEVLIGTPYDHQVDGQDGAVYRFTNEGKRYGYVTALIAANLQPSIINGQRVVVTYLFINGYSVYLNFASGLDAYGIANAINLAQITNVFAYVTEDRRLVIRLINTDLGSDNNKLNVTMFNGNYFYELGIAQYVKTQVIREPHPQHNSMFGYRIAFNEQNSFVVTAPKANRYAGTFFDKYNSDPHYNTVFDLNLTTFEDVFYNAGAAYMYDYIKPHNESLLNSGQYVYAQPVNDSTLVYGAQPLYGNSISFNDNIIMIGSPGYKSTQVGGKINVFENTSGKQNWSMYRTSTNIADIDQIQRVQLYNNITDENLVSLDYIDPLRGKLLGAVRENLDFVGISDPAGYNNTSTMSNGMIWNIKQVGMTWFNTNTTKFLDYHQDDLAYNAKYWGQIFPGSTVTVYTWIESDVTPAYYTGPGTPYNLQKYTTTYAVNSNNSLVQKYYYWVRNTNTVYGEKKLSDSILERYISSPQNSGIAYMAPLRSDTYALYNIRDYINGIHTNMHLGFSSGGYQTSIQNEFKLIQNNSPSDFLPGLPNYALGHDAPSGLYNRLLESFAGIDETGANVPNYTLPPYLQIGIGVRPRQSMFIDRFGALKNYLEYANTILAEYPINEFSNLTYLATTGDYFDTSSYWSNIYWWAIGYDNKTKTKVEVSMYSDLYKLTATEGLIAGVAKNGQGKREVYLYTAGAWTRIGLQDGTIQFSDKLWDYQTNKIGFGDNFFDTESFDTFPAVETYYIIRALNEQIYTGPLLEHRNKSLILMFEYIQSENVNGHNYLPWLNKTSFADVTYTVRDLQQDVNYHVDNTTLLSGYINEVKPYHTVIKDFDLRYTNTDIVYSNTSDFDVSAVYNSKTGKFISPKLIFSNPNRSQNEYTIGDSIWSNSNYANWYKHYGLALNGIPNFEIGVLKLYMTPTSNTLLIDNARGMPDAGILYVEDEIIGYNSVNRETGIVSGLTRGINNSIVKEHYPGITITTDLPGVVVLDTGRDYIDPPIVTAYIDTTKYPAPTREAVLQPVMSGGKVISIDILDPGENYAATPEIRFTSSYDVKFTQTNLNFINDTIIVPGTVLKTGDLIKSTCINGFGSIVDGFYYVYVVAQIEEQEVISITLHKTYSSSIIGHDRIRLHAGTISTVITGNEYIFSVTARAIGITTNLNVRGILNTLRFDRTSYIPKVVPWESNKFWGSQYNQQGVDNINSVSSDITLYYGKAYAGLTGPATNVNTGTNGDGAIFSVTNVLLGGTYDATVTNGGSNYGIFDTITIPGASLSGTTPTNNCIITVEKVSHYFHDLLQDITKNVNGDPGSGVGARFNITSNAFSTELTGALIFDGTTTVRGASQSKFTGTIEGNVLTATWVSGTIEVGAVLSGDNIKPHTYIVSNLTGVGTTGISTWTISIEQTISTSTTFDGLGTLFYSQLAPGSIIKIIDSIHSYSCTLATVSTVVNDPNSPSLNKSMTLTSAYTGTSGIYFAKVVTSTYTAEIDNVFYPGLGYQLDDTILITGDRLNGASPLNDLTIHVTGVDSLGKITKAAAVTNAQHPAPIIGSINLNDKYALTVEGLALDSNFASLQGAVMPILSINNDHGVTQNEQTSKITLTGTVTVTNGSKSVTGIHTLFLTELYQGAILYINGIRCVVDTTPTNNTSLSLVDTYSGNSGTYAAYVTVSGNVIVRLDYYPSSLEPGQIQGAKTYFYHNSAPYVWTKSDNTQIEIHRPRFNPYDVAQSYFIKIIDGGSTHYVGEVIIVSGVYMSGNASTNRAVITVTQIGNSIPDPTHGFIGTITEATVSGVSAKTFDAYYVQPVSLSEVAVFHDPGMKRPVLYSEFNYKHNIDFHQFDYTPGTPGTQLDYLVDYQTSAFAHVSDFAYIPEPFTLGLSYKYDSSSIVSYANKIWRCKESNNDTVFDAGKWIELSSDDRSINALDRIVAFYEPAANMPAKDLQQLVRGISYPGNVYYGNSFSPEDIIPIDVTLKGQELFPRTLDIKIVITNKVLLTGALSVTNGTNQVIGIGSLFDKELSYNSRIYINDAEYTVSNVTNNYSITLGTNYSGDTMIIEAYKFQYVAIAESTSHSLLLTSVDGITWNNHVLAEHSLGVTDIIYADGKYLVSTLSTNNPLLISYNAVDWLGQGQSTLLDQVGYDDDYFDSSPESYPADSVNKVLSGSDGFYYGVGSFITRSENGIVWYSQFDFGTKTINTIYDINEIDTPAFKGFIAVGGGNQILSGIDTAAPVVTPCSVIITSIDGRAWTLQNPFLTTKTLKVIISSKDIIVVAGTDGKLWYSVNGHNWTPGIISGSPVTRNLNAGMYDSDNHKFIIVGDYGTILTSTDGINWVQRTDNTVTVDDLNDVIYDGLHYYIVGSNAVIIRSSDTINWVVVSLLTPGEPESTVAGNDFLYGYGPEELIPGIITESLTLKVITSPGSSWDDTPDIPQSTYYENTGYSAKSITSTTSTVIFKGLVTNPAQLSVFLIDSTTKLGNRIYTGYTINWITKVVTLTGSLPAGKLLMVEVYEVGNGKQTSRSNSQYIPLRTNSITGHSEIYLNQQFTPLVNSPVVYVNGAKLLYQTDYDVSFVEDDPSLSKIIFNTTYNQDTDYITWAILDTSISDFRASELSYSIPETQVFTGSTSKDKILTNNIGGTNVTNAIVEKNGIRLRSTTDYSIDFASSKLTLVASPLSSDKIAVTTFNETDRLFLKTMTFTATSGQTVFGITQFVTNPNITPISYYDVSKLWVTINGYRIASEKLSCNPYFQSYSNSTNKTKTLVGYVGGTDTNNAIVKKNGNVLVLTTDYTLDLSTGTLVLVADPVSSDTITVTVLNNLIIDSTINAGDIVIVTATIAGGTPNDTTFSIDVDKYGQPTVYRSNDGDGTWLTRDFNLGDEIMHVRDVNTLLDITTQNTIVEVENQGTVNEMYFAYIECDITIVKYVSVYNQTSSRIVTNYVLEVMNGRSALVFDDGSQVTVDDILNVTLKIGNVLEMNGEKIRFTQVDFTLNTISGITRGILGTSPVQHNPQYTVLYGLTNNRTLDPRYYGVIWNTSNYSPNFGDPLQLSNSPSANFLQYGHY